MTLNGIVVIRKYLKNQIIFKLEVVLALFLIFRVKFGLYYVDFDSDRTERIPKLSVSWYRDLVTTHQIPDVPTVNAITAAEFPPSAMNVIYNILKYFKNVTIYTIFRRKTTTITTYRTSNRTVLGNDSYSNVERN